MTTLRITVGLVLMLVVLVFLAGTVGLVAWSVVALTFVVSAVYNRQRKERLKKKVEEGHAPPLVSRHYSFDQDFQKDATQMLAMGYTIASENVTNEGVHYVTYVRPFQQGQRIDGGNHQEEAALWPPAQTQDSRGN
jgi:hypothetical protein